MSESEAQTQLKQFTSGQSRVKLSEIKDVIKQFKPNAFWRALGITSGFPCTIVDKLTFPYDKNAVCILEYDHEQSGSTEHFVIFAKLHVKTSRFGSYNTLKVIVKFHMVPNSKHKDEVKLQNMTKEHCDGIVANYNKLHYYIKDAHLSSQIKVVPMCIVQGGDGINLWIEQRVDSFMRFANRSLHKINHLDWIVSVDDKHGVLKTLQKAIYEKSNHKHTICDIQGGLEHSTVLTYILCDVEFTDTLLKFDFKPADLLEAYKRTLRPGHKNFWEYFFALIISFFMALFAFKGKRK